jgi:hypothetical protein
MTSAAAAAAGADDDADLKAERIKEQRKQDAKMRDFNVYFRDDSQTALDRLKENCNDPEKKEQFLEMLDIVQGDNPSIYFLITDLRRNFTGCCTNVGTATPAYYKYFALDRLILLIRDSISLGLVNFVKFLIPQYYNPNTPKRWYRYNMLHIETIDYADLQKIGEEAIREHPERREGIEAVLAYLKQFPTTKTFDLAKDVVDAAKAKSAPALAEMKQLRVSPKFLHTWFKANKQRLLSEGKIEPWASTKMREAWELLKNEPAELRTVQQQQLAWEQQQLAWEHAQFKEQQEKQRRARERERRKADYDRARAQENAAFMTPREMDRPRRYSE